MNVFICEDDVLQREKIEKIINDIFQIDDIKGKIILSTDSSYKLMSYLNEGINRGVYFLDIDLNEDINGIELAKKINEIDKEAIIIMITSHYDMSYLTFKYHIGAIDFIVKGNYNHIKERVRECIIHANNKINHIDINDCFIISTSKDLYRIKYSDIIFFETCRKRVIGIHTIDGYMEFPSTMKELESRLDDRFIKCHKSFIVNKSKVKRIDKKRKVIVMENKSECFVSSLLIKKTIEIITKEKEVIL